MMHATSDEPTRHYYSTLPQDREPRIAAGTRVLGGQLTVIAELARGGMAIVYRALDRRRGGKEVALKVVNVDANPTEMAGRFRNEARLAGSLAGHPSFVRPLQVGQLDGPEGFEGRTYLVTGLLSGVSLDVVMSRHLTGLPMQRACTIARGVARALVELHSRGIVHRDVKPGNIVVSGKDDNEHVCLIDFGLAFATGDGWEARSPDLTTDGHAPGTPLYMSPQQVAHHRPEPAFDVYSLGVMLYEMFSGRPPNDRITLGELLARKCDPRRTPFPIGKMCPELPARLADLVGECMSYDPSKRPTAAKVVEVLDEVMRQGDPAAVDPEPVAAAGPVVMAPVVEATAVEAAANPAAASASPAVPEPQRAHGWMVAAGVALVVAVGAALLGTWPSKPPSQHEPDPIAEPSALASTAHAKADSSAGSDDSKGTLPAVAAPGEPESPLGTSAAEPEPMPVPSQPDPERSPDQPSRSKPSPTQPTSDRCAEDVRSAREAASRGDWTLVLRLTKNAKCWKGSADERTTLRTKALFETRQYAACAKQGARSSDVNVARLAASCKARAEEQGTTP